MRFRSVRGLAALLTLAAAAPLSAQTAAPYRLAGKIPVPGDGGWDYLSVDAAGRRLYVGHGTKVDVVDLDAGKFVGSIEGMQGVHGAAAVPAAGKVFITAGRTDEMVIADLKTLAETGRVKTGAKPDAIMYEPVTKRVFSFNGTGANATAVDPMTGKVVGTVDLGGGPEFAVADGKGKVFVNIEEAGEIVRFDAKTLKVEARASLKPCEAPSGLAMDRAKRRLFSVCANKLMAVVNADDLKVLQTLPIGGRVDAAGFDSTTGRAFASNGEGTLTVAAPDAKGVYTVAATVPTAVGARTMAFDPTTRKIYVATAEFGPAPAATEKEPRPRPAIVPGTFAVLVLEPVK